MSRFYDALKRAGQALPSEPREANPEIPSPLEQNRREAEEVLAGSNDVNPRPTDSPSAVELSPAVRPEQFPAPPSIPKNGHFGAAVQVQFNGKARVIPNIPDSRVLEQYRLLRTKLLQQQQEKPFKSLLITSPGVQDGKTVTTLNLALAFGLLPGSKVLVVEGDLRKGSLQQVLGLGMRPGFSDLIAGQVALEEVILKPEGIPVHVMVRGNSCHSPGELLHSSRLPTLVQELTNTFDLVLIDSPPVNLVTDAQLLASTCDAVLLIARAFSTSQKALEETRKNLLPFRVIGTVLNGGVAISSYYGYGGYY